VHHLSNKNDFSDDKSVDDREGVVQITNVILPQQKRGVDRECAEEEGQIQGDHEEVFEFVLWPSV